MHCASCVSRIEGAMLQVEGVTDASVNLATGRATVKGVDLDPRALEDAVEGAGYDARRWTDGGDSERAISSDERARPAEQEDRARRELGLLWAKFAFALVIGVLLIVLAFVWSPFDERATMWVMLALATPVQFWAGSQFYAGAWKVARHRTADMNTLIAIGTGAAYLYSLVATRRPGRLPPPGELPDVLLRGRRASSSR